MCTEFVGVWLLIHVIKDLIIVTILVMQINWGTAINISQKLNVNTPIDLIVWLFSLIGDWSYGLICDLKNIFQIIHNSIVRIRHWKHNCTKILPAEGRLSLSPQASDGKLLLSVGSFIKPMLPPILYPSISVPEFAVWTSCHGKNLKLFYDNGIEFQEVLSLSNWTLLTYHLWFPLFPRLIEEHPICSFH